MKRIKIAALNPAWQWGVLLIVTGGVTGLMRMVGLPGAFLMGPMVAGIIVALNGARLSVHVGFYKSAQASIGIMIAATVTPGILTAFVHDWPVFIGVVLASLVLSIWLGWLLCRFHVMPQTTGIWGITPGAASAMVVMAEIYGADVRLVAMMQYLRMLCVAVAATVAVHFCIDTTHLPEPVWFPPVDAWSLAATLAITAAGAALAILFKIPSGMIILPLIIGAPLALLGWVKIEVPLWWMNYALVVIGWTIGLRFTRSVMIYTLHALPKILVSIAVLIGFCALLAVFIAQTLNVDLLTAFLATSPGGAEVMIAIASSPGIDTSFVMCLQTVRLILVVLLAPPLAKWIANKTV